MYCILPNIVAPYPTVNLCRLLQIKVFSIFFLFFAQIFINVLHNSKEHVLIFFIFGKTSKVHRHCIKLDFIFVISHPDENKLT